MTADALLLRWSFLLRLDKFICKSTHLTKAEAVTRIQEGDVIVNGDIVVVELLWQTILAT